VPLVHHSARAQVAAALLAAAAALSGCLGDGSSSDQPAAAGARIGVPIRTADCGDWRRATPRERAGTIDDIEAFAGGPGGPPGAHGTTLPDDDAYRLFESYCRNRFARGFTLYKLYARAAGFSRHK
jgi:hypothetical protein